MIFLARLVTRKEARNRKIKLQIFAGMFDFLGTVGGLIVIAACVVLLRALVSWIMADANGTFTSLIDVLKSSIIQPEVSP